MTPSIVLNSATPSSTHSSNPQMVRTY
jgi:hypothetical protein